MSSGFVSELEIAEKRRVRQEEWEKVRQPSEPIEAPEEPYDHRSLFERLEEQKQKKQLEYEEAHKLKNMIKGLDDDEVEFLDLVDQKKLEMEQLKEIEEQQELADYRKKVEKLKENSLDERLLAEIRPAKLNCGNKSSSLSRSSQHQLLLKGVVVKAKKSCQDKSTTHDKSDSRCTEGECLAKPDGVSNECCLAAATAAGGVGGVKRKAAEVQEEQPLSKCHVAVGAGGGGGTVGLTCIGILPGLASHYGDVGGSSSDDESDRSCSSTCDDEQDSVQTKYDLMGRKIVYKTKEKTS